MAAARQHSMALLLRDSNRDASEDGIHSSTKNTGTSSSSSSSPSTVAASASVPSPSASSRSETHEEEPTQEYHDDGNDGDAGGGDEDDDEEATAARAAILTQVPPPEHTEFASWDDFHAFLQDYTMRTFQVVRVRTTTTVAQRNQKIAALHAARPERAHTAAPLLPDHVWKVYNLTITCTHSGHFASRGQGKRRRHVTRPTGCPFKINVCLRDVRGTYKVCITRTRAVHNHEVSASRYAQYPHNRLPLTQPVLEKVDLLRRYGVPKRKLLQFITEETQRQPLMRDIHNLVTRLRREEEAASAMKTATTTTTTTRTMGSSDPPPQDEGMNARAPERRQAKQPTQLQKQKLKRKQAATSGMEMTSGDPPGAVLQHARVVDQPTRQA